MYRVCDMDDVVLYEGPDYDEACKIMYSMTEDEGGSLQVHTKDGWQLMIVWRD